MSEGKGDLYTACPLISARVLTYVADEIVEAQDFFLSLFGFSVGWTSLARRGICECA